jgi:hypothetical protein
MSSSGKEEPPKAFGLLGQPESLWLEPEQLQEAWHQRSAELQARSGAGDGLSAESLNAAYATLASPAERLKLLISHRFPEVNLRTGQVPQALVEEFMAIGQLLQECGDYVKKRDAAAGQLARALLAPQGKELRAQLEARQENLVNQLQQLDAQLRELSPRWPRQADELLETARQLYQAYAFLTKWQRQLSAMSVEMME